MICFANFCGAGAISGVNTWFEKIVLKLHGSGTEVSVLLHGLDANAQNSPVHQSLLAAGVPVEYKRKPKFSEDGVKDTLQFLNRYGATVFAPQCLPAFYYAADIARRQGLPWIYTIHSDDPFYWAIAELVDLTHPLVRTVGVSRHVFEIAQKKFSDGVDYIPYGVDMGDKTASYRAEPFRVCFSGRVLEEQKRISLVIRTMAIACQQSSEIECVVLGDGADRKKWEAKCSELGLIDRVRFLGRLDSTKLRDVLVDTQAILLMSDYEGLPLALLEAMSMGVVPVVRNIPSGIPEIVNDGVTGLLTSDDPDDAATQLIRLSSDAPLWQNCSTNAKRLISDEYHDDACFRKWETVLAVAMSSSVSPPSIRIPKRIQLPPISQHPLNHDCRVLSNTTRFRNQLTRILTRLRS
ncbi:alpha-1,4-N-acetyl-D-galactosaminyltransferase [Novipirellula galeiformis]|uniref:Alpha-1,4-N-acetyl-D-galactosaminyltransferase n=1 Tax=Novipirellula galeiformis TaxID=2528004 RepID=A0A5C6CBK5_9BACT|nr:glycosyltransferase family 4 protein [Novipirellula galeiformis]TWU21217.1 alpha-1,4-N-acetyl-D-galactosaminyltransferase [Novipirellula galeiformis]